MLGKSYLISSEAFNDYDDILECSNQYLSDCLLGILMLQTLIVRKRKLYW